MTHSVRLWFLSVQAVLKVYTQHTRDALRTVKCLPKFNLVEGRFVVHPNSYPAPVSPAGYRVPVIIGFMTVPCRAKLYGLRVCE